MLTDKRKRIRKEELERIILREKQTETCKEKCDKYIRKRHRKGQKQQDTKLHARERFLFRDCSHRGRKRREEKEKYPGRRKWKWQLPRHALRPFGAARRTAPLPPDTNSNSPDNYLLDDLEK